MTVYNIDDALKNPEAFAQMVEDEGLIKPPEGFEQKVIFSAHRAKHDMVLSSFKMCAAAAIAIVMLSAGVFDNTAECSSEHLKMATNYYRKGFSKISKIIKFDHKGAIFYEKK